jgi:carbon monoxide dehydrogenase subunit G
MEIADTFRVSTPLDETWRVLLDIEGIAPCLPGAQLQEVEGNEYRGIVKVKVGPITAQYKGTATLVEADEAGRRIVLDASGRRRGQGNAGPSPSR